MQYILPTEKFEGLVNQQQWSTLNSIGINEEYILAVIISHIKLNGQIDINGKLSINEPMGLEFEIIHGKLDYLLDDIRERFLFNRIKLVPTEIVKVICVSAALLFQSLGYLLVEMIQSLQLKHTFQLSGLTIGILGKVHRGIAVDIRYTTDPKLRGYYSCPTYIRTM